MRAMVAPNEEAPESESDASGATIVDSSGEVPRRGPDADLRPGAICGRYTVEALIGSGGFSKVYRAADLESGATVALKVLVPRFVGTDIEVRFLREARALHQLKHPDILRIVGFGRARSGRSFLAAEYLIGANLRQVLRKHGRFDPAEVVTLMTPVCRALEAAHAAGIVHRDVKTSNVFVLDGEPSKVKLLDFGVAKFLRPEFNQGQALTFQGERLGTPCSMAPEQIRGGEVDGRADVYALGVMLFQLLTGRWPFRGSMDELEAMHLGVSPPKPSDEVPVSRELDQVVLRAMNKNPSDRFPTVEAFREAMQQAAGRRSAARVPPSQRPAIAVYLETWNPDSSSTTLDLIEGADLIYAAELGLREAGFQICVSSSSRLLAAAVLPWNAAEAQALARRTRDLAQALTLGSGEDRLRVRVHADKAEVVDAGGSLSFVGGPILEVNIWPTLDTRVLVITDAVDELLVADHDLPNRIA